VSTGRRRAQARASSPLPRLGILAGGMLLSALAWFFLVRAAIDFGHVARGGDSMAWLLTIGASAGAVVCLMLVFTLVARALVMLGVISDYRPRRSSGRRAR
jgi:hypothetical protein